MRYLAAVTSETLRLRSVLPVNFLEARRDVMLGDVSVPGGTPIFALTRLCSIQRANFAEPDRFDPERWLGTCPVSAEHPHNPRANFSFGGGPRTCPGRALALLECALVISMLVRRLEISHSPQQS